MKQLKIDTVIDIFDEFSELPSQVQKLMLQAFEARDKAYAPYSNFCVGAAVLLNNDVVFTGSNQENASYPSGLCAERTAIYYAGAQHPSVPIKTLAISAKSPSQELTLPVPPCGACRQAIAEYELNQEQPIEIYFMGDRGQVYRSESLKNILPLLFTKKYLD